MTNIISIFYSKHLCKILLLLIAAISMFSSRTFAQIIIEQEGVNFEVDTTYTKKASVISNDTKSYKGNIVIPDYVFIENQETHKVKQYPVTSIKELAFSNCKELESVIMPNSITDIGRGSFSRCINIKYIHLSDNLTKLSEGTFISCESLQNIDIPQSVTSIEDQCFAGCFQLTSITIPKSLKQLGGGCFYACPNLVAFNVESGNLQFESSGGVLISSDHSQIYAYPAAKKDTAYTVSYGVTTIPANCFAYCKQLKRIHLPNTLKDIGFEAFFNCGIDSMTVPNSVKHIQQGAFYACENLKFIKLSDSLEYIGPDCFRMSGLEEVVIPTPIANYFGNFIDCKNLKSVKLPEGLTQLGSFAGCTSLQEINIPQSITEIGRQCFARCKSITSIALPNALTKLGDQSFYEVSLTNVTLPASLVEYNYAFDCCKNLTEILVDENNTKFCSVNGILFSKEKDRIYQYPIGRNEIEFTVPNNVKGINTHAFAYSRLKKVNLPEGLSFIDAWSFWNSDIESIIVPNSVKSIAFVAFGACQNLKTVQLPATLEKLDYESFSGCTNLRTVYSLATTPPAATYDTFEKCPEDRILYVPKASLEDYKNADYWKDFAQILPIETAGINDVIDTDLVYSSKEKGKVFITGLHVGEIIQCYNASGLLIQTFKAASNEIAITTAEPIIIIKARKQTNKIFVKQ